MEAADSWKVKLAKYRKPGSESSPVNINRKSGTFNFEGFDTEGADTLIIDVVRVDEKVPVETTLEESFAATDCGTLTTEAKGTENSVGFRVSKNGEYVFTSQKPFTYDGNFNELTFNYTAPEGLTVGSVEAVTYTNETISGTYEDGAISFASAKENNVEYIIIHLQEAEEGSFTLTCDRTTVKINTNAVVYLKINKEITAADIKVTGEGKFKTPVYDATKGAWKVYIMPTALGEHTYTITVGDFSQDIIIQGSRTAL